MEKVYQLSDIEIAVDWLLGQAGNRRCFAFHGEMGAGKTTLISCLCDQLGVEDPKSSPTFSIINEYQTKVGDPLYHIDLYRLKDTAEAIQVGVEDAIYSGYYCFVEWPERAESLFPRETVHCYLSLQGAESRKLEIIL